MLSLVIIFAISAILIMAMIIIKIREVESGERSSVLGAVAYRLDPIVGRIVSKTNFLSAEVFGDVFRFFAAKIGLWTARALISLRNFSSKLAAHLYHTSRKAESGDPAASHPSFFIKAILEFKDKLREDRKDS